jgi:septum formation protein
VSHVDEDAAKEKLSCSSAADLALTLAQLKAARVSADYPDVMVIGADQTMECDGQLYDKPADMAAARKHLNALSGKTHTLHSAVTIARNEQIVWHHVSPARLSMRALSVRDVNEYVMATGDIILSSVGCYRLEDTGARLFDDIDGDYFTILGLPLLPLLAYLREAGAID